MQPTETVSIPEFTLGDRLRKARDHADLSQHDLAREIGIARSSIVNYETDRKVRTDDHRDPERRSGERRPAGRAAAAGRQA